MCVCGGGGGGTPYNGRGGSAPEKHPFQAGGI